MDIKGFAGKYKHHENLHDIPWYHFPEEVQKACLKFIGDWQESISIDHLRILSGFNEMSFQDLMRYIYGELHEDVRPAGCPYKTSLF